MVCQCLCPRNNDGRLPGEYTGGCGEEGRAGGGFGEGVLLYRGEREGKESSCWALRVQTCDCCLFSMGTKGGVDVVKGRRQS